MRISDWSSDVCSSDLKLTIYRRTQYSDPNARLERSTLSAKGLGAVIFFAMAKLACHDIGLASNRQVQLIGDAVVADRRTAEVPYQLFDLSGSRHSAGHGYVIITVAA